MSVVNNLNSGADAEKASALQNTSCSEKIVDSETNNISENISDSSFNFGSNNDEKQPIIRNFNILDCFPAVKKHPYLALGFLCVLFNFAFSQGSVPLASSWITAVVFGLASVSAVVYLSKTVEDFVFSPRGVIFIAPIFILVCIGGIAFKRPGKGIFLGSVIIAFSLLLLFFILKKTGRLTTQNALFLVFLTGFAVRVIYALYTPIADNSIRQHDVWRFIAGEGDALLEKFNNRRHAEYIEYIAKYLKLPDVNPSGGLSQLYHPPFHHIIAGLWLRFNMNMGMGYKTAVEGIQFLTVFYSSSCMITGYKIFRELGFTGKKLLRATTLLSLFPWFFLFAGGVNNDILSVALGFAAILTTIRWYKNPKIINLILIAVSLGLAMFTKLSMGLLAPAIAFVFLAKFISVCKKRENVIFTKKGEKQINAVYMIFGFAVFAIVVFPLGLGWQVKNLILWDMPLTYVPSLAPTTSQYIGFHSIIERFFGLNVDSILNPFVVWGDKENFGFWEYNMFLGGIKTALFGEDSFFAISGNSNFIKTVISTVGTIICSMLYIFGLMLVVFFIVSVFRFFKNKFYGMNKTLVQMFIIIFATFLGNYIVFCFGYPFTCTMNFRYIVPCLFLPIMALSADMKDKSETCLEINKESCVKEKESRLYRTYSALVKFVVCGFCICGVLVYVLLALMPY